MPAPRAAGAYERATVPEMIHAVFGRHPRPYLAGLFVDERTPGRSSATRYGLCSGGRPDFPTCVVDGESCTARWE